MAQSQGDNLAQADGYLEPAGVDFSYKTWQNYPVSDETMDEKSKRGGERENVTYPTITINTPTSATSADNYTFTGSVNDYNAQIHSLSYELTGGNSDSGLITSGKFLRRISRPFGGTWKLPVSPIAVGQTVLFMRGRNVKGRWGPIRDSSITRSPSGIPGPVVPCECTVFTDPFLVITPDWTETDASGIASPGPNGYEHLVHAADFGRLLSQGNFVIGGDFDICVEVDITNFTATPGGTTYFQFGLGEGVKGGADTQLHIQVDTGALVYYLSGTGNFGLVPTVPTAIGTHYLRFTRIGTTLTAWVWNSVSQQFEWNGNPAGITHDGVWDLDPYAFIQWRDTSGADWIEGTCKAFCINAGLKV